MISREDKAYCPACGKKSLFLLYWEYSGLNDSIFNYTACYHECRYCGLVYNSSITDERLSIFYKKECTYYEKKHFDIFAPENKYKYKCYMDVLVNSGLSNTAITDIGCGRGGFLLWLKKKGWNANCMGIDIDIKSIPKIITIPGERNQDTGIVFQEGRAIDLPFPSQSQSIMTYFHVLEHIVDLNAVLKEAYRVLLDNGHVLMEVPDSERYQEYPIGTAFWFSIREHVYHFSISSISHALYRNGFAVISIHRNILPTPEFTYPSLIVLAQKRRAAKKPEKCKDRRIATYAIQSKNDLKTQAENVSNWESNFSRLTFWGCSAEFFSLLPILNMQHFAICDSSENKQKCFYKGIPIENPATILKKGALIVVPYLFSDSIWKEAMEQGWAKEAILCLK